MRRMTDEEVAVLDLQSNLFYLYMDEFMSNELRKLGVEYNYSNVIDDNNNDVELVYMATRNERYIAISYDDVSTDEDENREWMDEDRTFYQWFTKDKINVPTNKI